MKKVHAIGLSLALILLMLGTGLAGLNDGLVAYYPFNGNANDESGNGHNGIIQGATLTADRFGNANSAYNFNGVDNNIELENTTSYDMFSGFSLVAWVNFTNSADQSIISKHKNHLKNSYNIATSGHIVLNTNNRSTYIETPNTYNDGNWHFIVGIYNGTANTTTTSIYVDGALMVAGKTEYSIGSAENIRIGSDSSMSFFNGTVDDVRIYSRVISESEILELYNEGSDTCSYKDSDNDGVVDLLDKCPDTSSGSYTDSDGCPASGLYSEEQMNDLVKAILTWGDTDGDKKITLIEAIHALRITSGITEPQQ